MKTNLFISRHGAKDPAYDGVWTGHLDVSLSPRGAEQARLLGAALRDVELAAVVTSTMQRGEASGKAFLEGYGADIPLETFDELREMNHGAVDGLPNEDFKRKHPEILKAWSDDEDPTFPNGESFADVEARIVPVVEDLLKRYRGKNILFIGHKSVNMVLLGHFLHVPLPFRYILQQEHCNLTLLTFSGAKWKLQYSNCPPGIAAKD